MKYLFSICFIIITACSATKYQNNNKVDFKKLLNKGEDIILHRMIIDEELDLVDLLEMKKFNSKSFYGQVKSNLFFMDCTFKKPFKAFALNENGGEESIQFKGNVSFINCKFEDTFTMKSCTISGAADFSNTTFKKAANFQDVIFTQRSNFNKAFWADEALFQNARFYHKSNFVDIKVDNHMMFQSTVFHDETNFSLSECLKYVDFSLARFDGLALFNYIKWNDRAVFNNALWNMDCYFIDPQLGDISFKNSKTRGQFKLQKENIRGKYIPAKII